jgi:hypothetical protein
MNFSPFYGRISSRAKSLFLPSLTYSYTMTGKLVIITSFLIFLNSCSLREREEALDKRSVELDQKEQELLLKERSLQLKEEELKKRDSLSGSIALDSTGMYDPHLVGLWAVKMVCTEATCPGSAVGDTKNETWQVSFQNKNILVRAQAGSQLVRVYSGRLNGNFIELEEDHQTNPTTAASKISVRLTKTDSVTLEGHREINRDGNCKIVYSVNMSKQ